MIQGNNNICLTFLFVFIYFFSIFRPSIQQNDPELAIIANALDSLVITPLATSYDIMTVNECSYEKTIKCLLNSYLNETCFSSIYYERISNHSHSNIEKNADMFLFHLDKCSMEEVKKYLTSSKTSSSLPILTNLNGGITTNMKKYSKYPQCNEFIKDCLNPRDCIVPSQYNAFDKIIDFCSEKAFKKLNISNISSTTVPPATTYVDDLNELAANKIGLTMYLEFLSYASLPENIRNILQNLTYEDLDAIKMIATINPHLKQFLCDSNAASVKLDFDFVKDYLTIESSKVPDNVKKAFLRFDKETYTAVKEVLKAHPTMKWLICSSIFAFSSSSTTSDLSGLSKVGYLSSSISTRNNDQITSLRNCKNLAEQDDLNHSAICTCKRSF